MPELSIVMAGSNDNYGGEVYREVETTPTSDFKDRCSRCFFTLHEAFKYIDYEVIFVVWNEDPSRESLLNWSFLKHPRIRRIVVPSEIAATVEPDCQFHETWSKNVGIRRAGAEMILTTNPDVLWLDPFPREALLVDSVMIAQRWTVNKPILDVGFNMVELKRYAADPATRRNLDWNSNGDFTLMPKWLWFTLKGLCTPQQAAIAGVDMWQIQRAQQITGKVYRYPFPIYHTEHCGRPLSSSYGQTISSDNWGFPNVTFDEYKG